MALARMHKQRDIQRWNVRWSRQRKITRGGSVSPAAPTITSRTPSSIVHGAATTSIAVVGTGFVSGATVSYTAPSTATKTVATTFTSPTSVSFSIPAGDLDLAGSISWSLRNPDNQVVNGAAITLT